MAETVSSAASAPRRPAGRPWPKGVSGNPGGLGKDTRGLIERVRRLALRYAPRAIQTLAELLANEDPRVRVAAAEGLLDRAGLRPFALEPERVEVTATVDVDALRATLAARVAGLTAAARDSHSDSQVLSLQPAPAAEHTDDDVSEKDGTA